MSLQTTEILEKNLKFPLWHRNGWKYDFADKLEISFSHFLLEQDHNLIIFKINLGASRVVKPRHCYQDGNNLTINPSSPFPHRMNITEVFAKTANK